jgi:hypothetical protein
MSTEGYLRRLHEKVDRLFTPITLRIGAGNISYEEVLYALQGVRKNVWELLETQVKHSYTAGYRAGLYDTSVAEEVQHEHIPQHAHAPDDSHAGTG